MMFVDNEKCIGCTLCKQDCIVSDIEMRDGKAFIKNETCISCGHCIAICPKNAVATNHLDMEEVKEYNKETFEIKSENLLNFIKFRRSVRLFKEQKVEEEKIKEIIEAGRFTQTGSNMQDVSYVVVREKIQELRELVLETLNEYGKGLMKDAETPKYIKRYAAMWMKMYKDFKNDPNGEDKLFFKAPLIIAVKSPSEVNGALASSNMELMVDSLGLGTYFSGFLARAAMVNPKINEFLGIKEGEKLVTCMIIGYPRVTYKRTVPRNKANIEWL